jgi:CheY-like chemotaxis protein
MGQSKPIAARSILIVEDEALIRFNLIDFFEDAGYRVFEAESADEAIAILDRDSTIRIVLTDIQMPGSMDGLRLAHYIRDRFPPTVLAVTSGMLSPTKADLPADSFFVAKPFDTRRLLGQIEALTG